MSKLNISELDAKIRETVRILNEYGFETCDSGDGSKYPEMECARDHAHVSIIVTPEELVDETDRLLNILDMLGVKVGPIGDENCAWIQASYDPVGETAILEVLHLTDDMWV